MQVYYFTRTGRSENIANDIARVNDCVANKIEDNQNWKGAGSFIKGGYMSSTKKQIPIEYETPESEGDIILVFPIWAGTFPPAVRTFIDEVGREKIILIPTSLGSILKDRDSFKEIYDLSGKEIKAPTNLLK